jgi:hydroxymethylpyrimidine pyrophosphatase-like HAD family hydrolase
MSTFRAVAVDYDGTLTTDGAPSAAVLDAVAGARARGLRVLIVTGRILSELRAEFPDVMSHCDAIVTENGAALAGPDISRSLAPPIEPELVERLRSRDVPCRHGDVIVAAKVAHREAIAQALQELGLDHQMIVNRSELMVVPAGVTKATGVDAALDEFGISSHSTIAVGDAENDHALLMVCEIGVAVANAVEPLKRHADVVTSLPDGDGVIEVLAGPLLSGRERVHPARWQLVVGAGAGGAPVTIPSSQVNVLVTGATASGKSHAAGMLAEQLIRLGYSVLVIDPEGDFEQLGQLPGVVVTGGHHAVTDPDEIISMLRHRSGSVVIDLSQRPRTEVDSLYRRLPALVEASRAASGIPHWVVLDEAHERRNRRSVATMFFTPEHRGYLLVTYHPDDLDEVVRNSVDIELRLADRERGHATLVRLGTPGEDVVLAPRQTPHRRHWHKYATTQLPRQRGFWFRHADDRLTGAVATSLAEFHNEISRSDADTLRHHAAGGDFSRWIDAVYGDHELAARVSSVEQAISVAPGPDAVERARRELQTALAERLFA